MKRHSIALTLIVLSSVLVSSRCQDTYPSHLSVLSQLSRHATSQDRLGEILFQSLSHVTGSKILSTLDGILAPRDETEFKEADSVLKFESEASNRRSVATTNLQPQCVADVLASVQHKDTAPWAQRMVDATGKPGAGILAGRFLFLGDFDECLAVRANYTTEMPGIKDQEFNGRYCFGRYKSDHFYIPPAVNTGWGFCLPDSCSETDSLQLVQIGLSQLNVTAIKFKSMTCNRSSVSLNGRAVTVFTMLAVILILVVLGTAVDILLIQMPKWRVREEVRQDLGGPIQEAPFQPFRVRRDEWSGRIEADPLIVSINPLPLEIQTRQSILVKLLVVFSAWSNTEKLIATSQPPGSLSCLHGIRVLSINWVVLGHTVLLIAQNGDNVLAYAQKALGRWTFQPIVNGTFSVDTFFVLSGVLVAYTTLNLMKKTEGKMNWFKFYIHRYLRLTPVYMIIMWIYLGTLPYMINGPLYDQKNGFEQDHHCKHSWWGNPLYVQNLVRFKPHFCMSWSWYLAVDMQFYILSPLMLLPLYYRPKLGYLVTCLFLLTTTITPLVLTETRKYPSSTLYIHLKGNPKPLGDEFYDIYFAPFSRMGPYLVGLMCGYILSHLNRRPVKISTFLVVLGWSAAVATGLAVVYGLFPYFKGAGMDLHAASVYNGVSRTAWALSVVWVIFSCVTGHGGVVNMFLSWSLWVPLSRLTYVVYLIHLIVLHVLIASARTPVYASDFTIIILYLAALTLTYALAFVCSVLFESPGLALEKLLLKRKQK